MEPGGQRSEPGVERPVSGSENRAPIGVFDSGVGGLSVLRDVRRELPAEDLIYVADSGHAPYGDKTQDYVQSRAVAMVEFLLSLGAKAIVVACNTATGIAVDALRARYELPIVAIEPAVKPAASRTRSGVVGVLATTRTLASPRYSKLLASHAREVSQPGPGLVERVEAGDLTGPETRTLVEQYVRPLVDQGADTIVLGCTHYPFLTALIQDVAGPGVTIVDPAVAVARELRRRLQVIGLLAPETDRGHESFWTTGPVGRARDVIGQLWGRDVDVRAVPESVPADETKARTR
jgi:glutamate racemase